MLLNGSVQSVSRPGILLMQNPNAAQKGHQEDPLGDSSASASSNELHTTSLKYNRNGESMQDARPP